MRAVRRWVLALASLAVATAGALAVGSGAASAADLPGGAAYVDEGACGNSWTETATDYRYVFACAGSGNYVNTTTLTPATGPFLFATVGRCPKAPGSCSWHDVSGQPAAGDVAIDPLLRTASVNTVMSGCAINLGFWSTSDLEPDLYNYNFEGIFDGGPYLTAGGGLTTYRDAAWSGSVCGMSVSGGASYVQLWRGGGGGVFVGNGGDW